MQSAADLALAYVSQGKFAEGEPFARQAVAFNEKKQPRSDSSPGGTKITIP